MFRQHRFRAFGRVFDAPVHFPEFLSTGDPPAWTFARGPTRTAEVLQPISVEEIGPDSYLRVYRTESGFLLNNEQLGSFELREESRSITWDPGLHDCENCFRMIVIGRVLPLALFLDGMLTLHGSAVAVDGEGVAFLGAKHVGKSTLVHALVQAGARLASDDCVPVVLQPSGAALMHPGSHQVRLWDDSADHFFDNVADFGSTHSGKWVLDAASQAALLDEPVPLASIYLLKPPSADQPLPARVRVAPVIAAVDLVRNSKIGSMLDRQAETAVFRQAAAVAATVPVYELTIPRGFDLLDDAVRTITGWHTAL